MRQTSVSIAVFLITVAITSAGNAYGQDVVSSRGVGGNTGSNPLGNVAGPDGTTPGTVAGTYVAMSDHGDGTYTLHYITTDAVGNVVSHTTETYDAAGDRRTGIEYSEGEYLGDVIEDKQLSFWETPFGCDTVMDCGSELPGWWLPPVL